MVVVDIIADNWSSNMSKPLARKWGSYGMVIQQSSCPVAELRVTFQGLILPASDRDAAVIVNLNWSG